MKTHDGMPIRNPWHAGRFSRRPRLAPVPSARCWARQRCVPGQVAEPAQATEADDRMKIGVNLEYVRHADKSLTYGVQTAGKMGYKYVEPCFLMGRCLLSNAGYCHVTSLDTDPLEILDLCTQAGVKISGLSSHSDLLNPEWGVLYARRGIRYARALGVNIVQITEDMYPPKWMTEQDAYSIMKINLLAIAETCEENGVYIAVEQHGPYTAKIKSLTRILELVDSPWIKVNYDCGNTYPLRRRPLCHARGRHRSRRPRARQGHLAQAGLGGTRQGHRHGRRLRVRRWRDRLASHREATETGRIQGRAVGRMRHRTGSRTVAGLPDQGATGRRGVRKK